MQQQLYADYDQEQGGGEQFEHGAAGLFRPSAMSRGVHAFGNYDTN